MRKCGWCGKRFKATDKQQKYCGRTHATKASQKRKHEKLNEDKRLGIPDPASLGWWCPPNANLGTRYAYWNPEYQGYGKGFGPELAPITLSKRGERLCFRYSEISAQRRIMSYANFNKKVCYTKEEAEKRLADAGEGEIYLCTYTHDEHWHYSRKGK